MNNKLKGISATLLSATYFGFLPILMKVVYDGGGNTLTASFYRFFFSLIPLFVYLKVKKIDLKISKEDFKEILIVTIFGYGGTTALLFGSYNFIPTGMSTTIHFLYPTFTMLGSFLIYKDKFDFTKLLCVLMSFIGVILFYNGDGGTNLLGMGLAFLSSITYAFYTILLGKSNLKNMNSLKLIFYMNIVASVMYMTLGLLCHSITFNMTAISWTVLFTVSILTTFIGVLGYQIGVRYVGHVNTAILSTFEPITSVIIGFALNNEKFGIKGTIGIILILISTIIIAKKSNKEEL